MAKNLKGHSQRMREQDVESQHFQVRMGVNDSLHIGPNVLCASAGVNDSDHLNINKVSVDNVLVHMHDEPVGVTFHLPNSADSDAPPKMLPATHRTCYVSSTQDARGEPAHMAHAIGHGTHSIQSVDIPLDFPAVGHAMGDARSTRWNTVKPADIGSHPDYDGCRNMTNETTGEVRHLVPVNTAASPMAKFFESNASNDEFLGKQYKTANRQMVDVDGTDSHFVVKDEHMKAAADALRSHLTPEHPLANGLMLTTEALDGHVPDPAAKCTVSFRLHRTPIPGDKVASGEAAVPALTSLALDSPAEASLHAKVFSA